MTRMTVRRWRLAKVLLSVAVLTAGGIVWAVAARESAYDRCFRIAQASTVQTQQTMADVRAPDPTLDTIAARITCDYLDSQGRLGEITDGNARALLMDALHWKQHPAAQLSP